MNDLDQALADAVERYRAAHPQSARIHADALQALPGGNTNAPTIMIAERAADLIKAG